MEITPKTNLDVPNLKPDTKAEFVSSYEKPIWNGDRQERQN